MAGAEIPLGRPAFHDHLLWAYALFEILLVVAVFSVLLAFADRDEPPRPGTGHQGDGGVGLGL
ncbi:hypothetical protein [Streptomyces echinatus]|uniref:hypothetical protein n=1 Tax=Streptomyces echinatus TaxID=67293 RepID=UPI003787859A